MYNYSLNILYTLIHIHRAENLPYSLQVNGILKRVPYTMTFTDGSHVKVKSTTDLVGVVISTDFGLSLQYDGLSRLTLRIPQEYRSLVCGLCGDYDGIYNPYLVYAIIFIVLVIVILVYYG